MLKAGGERTLIYFNTGGNMAHLKSALKIINILFILFSIEVYSQTKVISFGSNPDFSYSLFPQDVAKIRANNITALSRYCKSPWWGDIDQFDNKPNGTYTITGNQEIRSSAFFQESAKMRTTQNQIGYNYRPSENFTLYLDANFTFNFLSDIAKGNFTYDNNGTREGYVPFDYKLRHTLYDLNLRGTTAFKISEIPFGAMLTLGNENSLRLSKGINFIRGQDTVSSERAFWGWSKVGCNHIFGVRGTEGDAWFQNNYSTGPLYKLNFRAGADLEKIKAGLNVYTKTGSQDYYSWRENTTDSSLFTSDTLLNERFIGKYVKSDWQKKSRETVISAYGNIHWMTHDQFGIHTFVSLSYNGNKAGNILNGNDDVESDSKETVRGFALEFDPNINIRLGNQELHYVDIALLSRYNYNRYNNTTMTWVNGGRIKTYWDGSTPYEEEDVWERFSFANQHMFDLGLDISTMFPILSNNFGNLGFGFILNGSSRLNFTTKHFGDNEQVGSENVFTVFAKRYNFEREIQFNSSLLFDYTYNPLRIRLEITEPVLQNLLKKTKIKTGDQKTYSKRTDPLWLSEQGLQLGLFLTYNFQFSFLPYHNNVNTGY